MKKARKKTWNLKITRSVLLGLALQFSVAGLAQAAETVAKVGEVPQYDLDEVVVTATKIEQKTKDVPASITVVTAKDIEKLNITTVDQAMKYVAGAFADRRRGWMDTLQKVELRGFGDQKRTLVLLDGQPLNQGYNGEVNWSSISLENVEKIEVVKGGFSALYGGNAMGGVINIITKTPQGKSATVTSSFGTDNTQRYTVQLSDKLNDKWSYSLGYERKTTDGYASSFTTKSSTTSGSAMSVTGWQQTPTTTGGTQYIIGDTGDNNWTEDTYNFKMNYKFDKDRTLSIGFLHDKYEYGYGMFNSYLRNTAGATVVNGIVNINGKKYSVAEKDFVGASGGKEANIYSLSYRDKANGITFNSSLNDMRSNWYTSLGTGATYSGGAGTLSESPSKSWYYDLQKEFKIGEKDTMVAGVNYKQESSTTEESSLSNWRNTSSKTAITSSSGGKTKTTAFYLQDEHQINKQWSFIAGARYDNWKAYDGYNALGNTQTHSEDALSPKIAVLYKEDPSSTYHLSWGKSFRAPNIYELFRTWYSGTSALYEANPDLSPETVKTIEIGWEKELNEKTNLKLTYYHNDIDNLIYRTTVGKTAAGLTWYKNANAAKGTTDGVEMELTHKLNDSWSFFTNYTYQHAIISNNPTNPASNGKMITNVPEQIFNIGADYQKGKWGVNITGSYVGKRFSNDGNTDEVNGVYGSYDPYFVVNTNVRYQVNKNTTIILGVDNLLDRQYYAYYLNPGRTFTLEVKHKF